MRETAPVITCHDRPTHAFHCRNLETGETAVVLTRPFHIPAIQRWSWKKYNVVWRGWPRRR